MSGTATRCDVLVVGGGPTGLSFAARYAGDCRVLEREPEVGGLCRSIERDGGIFDVGGHSFHTPHPDVRGFVEGLMAGCWETQRRDARVFSHGVLLPYPFQRYYAGLPDPSVVAECRVGLASVPLTREPENFEEWIVWRFGQGIADHFMLPYNRKLWAHDLRRLSCDWVGERVAAPHGERPEARNSRRRPLEADTIVGYPAQGGFGEIYRRLARRLPALQTGRAVVRIDPVDRVAASEDGAEFHWKRLVSTIPLPRLLRVVEGAPTTLIDLADSLEHTSLDVLLILVGRALPEAPQRVYVADPAIPPHKITFNHTSSIALRRRPVHAIMAEVSYSSERPLGARERLERDTTRALVDMKLLPTPADVVSVEHLDVPYAYPVHTPTRAAIVAQIKAWLRSFEIYTCGRFGEWEYVNSDECIKRGMALAAAFRTEDAPRSHTKT